MIGSSVGMPASVFGVPLEPVPNAVVAGPPLEHPGFGARIGRPRGVPSRPMTWEMLLGATLLVASLHVVLVEREFVTGATASAPSRTLVAFASPSVVSQPVTGSTLMFPSEYAA